ncbi:MAG TPA: asparaginase domain-containing protein [Flavitalea sp.]|nr:asparaginase domain-containing protein [Flavitalea sp.]
MTIRILITGGTFDKEYNELTGELFFKDTHIKEMLSLGRNRTSVVLQTLYMMDSLQMQDVHRQHIAQSCIAAAENHLLITHGTDTMAETAMLLQEKSIKKTIVLTGAMIPYKFGSSDGLFNLGSALAFVQTLPAGVYIAMNGQYFHAGKVKKNKKEGTFEELN